MAQSIQRRASTRIPKRKYDPTSVSAKEEIISLKALHKIEDTHSSTVFNSCTNQIDKSRISEIKQNIMKLKNRNSIVDDIIKWHPTDDLTLILSVQQCNDLVFVHRCIQFTRPFTLQEIQERWYQLLYNQAVSKHAQEAIRELPTEIINKIHENVLWSEHEELILSAIPIDNETNDLFHFQTLLDKFRHIFYPHRTADSLRNHYNCMKTYGLLNDQSYDSVSKRTLATIAISKLRQKQDNLPHETISNDDKKVVEANLIIDNWLRLITNTVNEIYSKSENRANHLNSNALQPLNVIAELKGQHNTYLMKDNEITIGRTNSSNVVDFDLSLEGSCNQISNVQAVLRYDEKDGTFILKNIGHYDIMVDGKTVIHGNEIQIDDSSQLKFGKLFFEFVKINTSSQLTV